MIPRLFCFFAFSQVASLQEFTPVFEKLAFLLILRDEFYH